MGVEWEDRTLDEKICIVLSGCFILASIISLIIEIGIGSFPLVFWLCLSCGNTLLGIVNLRSQRVLAIVMIVIHGLAALFFAGTLLLQIL